MPANRPAQGHITPRSLMEIRTPLTPRISPDGTRVVFVVLEADFHDSRWVPHLWIVDLPDGTPRQVTYGYDGEHTPAWSRDGKQIAFVSARPDPSDGDCDGTDGEDPLPVEQIWVLPAHGGEARRITRTRDGILRYQWKRRSDELVYLALEPRQPALRASLEDRRRRRNDPILEHEELPRRQLWRVGLTDTTPALICPGDPGIMEFDISPDDRRLVYSGNRTGEPNDFHLFDLFILEMQGDTPAHPLVRAPGAKYHPRWSPDGKALAYLGPIDPEVSFSQECIWTIARGQSRPSNRLVGSRYDAHEIEWGRAGGGLYAIVADGTRAPVVRIANGDAAPLDGMKPDSECLDFDVHSANLAVAVIEHSDRMTELYLLKPGKEPKQLTTLNDDWSARHRLPVTRVTSWQSDEHVIEALVVRPAGEPAGPMPMVVEVHGGPKGRCGASARSYVEPALWASQGYLVLRPNFRGSEGYGAAFAVASRRDLGGGDYRDIMAGIDKMVADGLADPNRIGIIGGSYGGFMVNWAVTQTDRFAAAISMFGIFDLRSDYGNSEMPRWEAEYLGGPYWSAPEAYDMMSPATFAGRIKTPMLIIHGDSDTNTFVSNSQELYTALRHRGVEAQYVRYPREGHGIQEPNHRIDELQRCLDWFGRHLCDGLETGVRRSQEPVRTRGFKVQLLRCEDFEPDSPGPGGARLVEVQFAATSTAPMKEPWRFRASAGLLRFGDGPEREPVAVIIDGPSGRHLLKGTDLVVEARPDRDTGVCGVVVSLLYEAPEHGGPFAWRLRDFPALAGCLASHPAPPRGA